MRGGRKMDERGANSGEEGSGHTLATTLFTNTNAGSGCGKAWKPQHQQIPLQSSGGTVC